MSQGEPARRDGGPPGTESCHTLPFAPVAVEDVVTQSHGGYLPDPVARPCSGREWTSAQDQLSVGAGAAIRFLPVYSRPKPLTGIVAAPPAATPGPHRS